MIKLNYDPKVITVIVQGLQVELGNDIHNILVLGRREAGNLISPNKNIRDKSNYQQISGHNLAYSIFDMEDWDDCIESLNELIEAHKNGNIIKPILCYIKTINFKDKAIEDTKIIQFISLIRELILLSREPNSQINLFVLDQYSSLSQLRYDFDYYVDIQN